MKPATDETHPVDVIAEEMNPDGWWKQDARDTFIACYDRLISKGITECDALEILGDLYHATASEFGV